MDKLFLFFLAVLCIFYISCSYENEDTHKLEQKNYCDLVSLWESDADAGINTYDRAGHPNYKGVECND